MTAMLTLHWSLDVALVLFSACVAAAYFYMTRNFNHWRNRGVFEITPKPFFGNFFDCCLFRISPSMLLGRMYEQGKGLPYLGFYAFDKPALLIRDPDIARNILIKDFGSFPNRHASTHESDTLAAANMFLLKQPNWKFVRSKVSPIFTAGKMKKMFGLMLEVGEDLTKYFRAAESRGKSQVLEMKDVCAKFTTDVITSCAFGLQGNALSDPDSPFREYGVKIFGFTTYLRCAEFAAFFFIPSLVKLFKLKFFSAEGSKFLREIFTNAMTTRMKTKIHRNDLIDMLIQVKESQEQNADPNDFKFYDKEFSVSELEGDRLAGQAATFFAAGFETSSTTMAFSIYELALHPQMQSKLREEIVSALEETGGKITYEMVMNLPYLDMVVSETLRKYPSLPILDREPIRDYKVPGNDLTIEKGTPVFISLLGLHYDPEYYPEPEKFDPERFSKENKNNRPACVYMPFGDGPHNCVGLRFGLLVSKLGVLKTILDYEVTACPQTMIPMRFDPKAISILPKSGIFLDVHRVTT